MDIDPVAMAELTAREVRTGERDGHPTRITVARRTYATDQFDLWDAITSPERLPRWFLPVSGNLEVGGSYQLEGNASGTVEACDRPESFAVTWEFGGQISWLRIALSQHVDDSGAAATTLELEHEAVVDPQFWDQFGPGATGVGWDLGMLGLGLHLESGSPVDPAEAMAWPTTPAGHTFVTRVAASWAAAAEEDGDDSEHARASAERTIAFYTTPPA